MYQTRSVTRKQREKQADSPTTDSNDQAGGAPTVDESSLPCSQDAGKASAINIGGLDIAAFDSLEEFLCYGPLQQGQQEEQQEQRREKHQKEWQLVLYNPKDADILNRPYLPWDCPGSDQCLYPFPVSVMADDQRYLSPSYYVDQNFFANGYMHQQQQHQYQQFIEYQSLQPWVSPALEQAAVLDVRDIQDQGQISELLFENGEGSYEPLPFEYAAMPDHLIQDPLLDERWAATFEGDLFGHSQALDGAIKSELMSIDDNVNTNPQVVAAPITQEQQEHLSSDERLDPSHPPIPLVAGTKVDIEKARRRRLAGRRRKGPKPKVEVDWLPSDADRETKDRFLVESRRNAISYKLIKMYGRFQEAESTLRGRYRTLTKRREDRVRDPQWTPIDIQLLKEAVQVYAGGQHPDRAGISWMMVSQYITSHGGTYAFGYTTCHRRWLHLEATGQLGDNWADQSWGAHDDENNEEDGDEMEGVETEANDEDEDEDEDEDDGEDEDEDDDGNYGEED